VVFVSMSSRNKRTSSATERQAKRQKQDPMLEGITSTINMASLPSPVKSLLVTLAPPSFTTPLDQRHELQAMTVRMVSEVFDGVLKGMNDVVAEKVAANAAVDQQRVELEGRLREAEAATAAAAEVLVANKSAQADITQTVEGKRLELEEARRRQQAGDGDYNVNVKASETYRSFLEKEMREVMSGDTDVSQCEAHFRTLQPLLVPLNLDASLSSTLPITFSTRSADRSGFSVIVFQALMDALEKHHAELESIVAAGAGGVAERAAAVEEAAKLHAEWVERQETLAEAIALAEQAGRTAAESVVARKDELAKFEAEHAEATQDIAKKREELDAFRAWNLECLTTLKTQVSKKPGRIEVSSPAPVQAQTDAHSEPQPGVQPERTPDVNPAAQPETEPEVREAQPGTGAPQDT